VKARDYNPRKWFDASYFRGGRSNYCDYLRDHRFPLVARTLTQTLELRGKRVLDCGCAVPYLVHELRKLGVGAVGFDISDYAAERVRREKLGWFLVADARFIPFADRSFDAVIASELVEHVPSEHEALLLAELCRVSKRMVLVRTPWAPSEADRDDTHVNIHPPDYWKARMRELGFASREDLEERYARAGRMMFPGFFDWFMFFERLDGG